MSVCVCVHVYVTMYLSILSRGMAGSDKHVSCKLFIYYLYWLSNYSAVYINLFLH